MTTLRHFFIPIPLLVKILIFCSLNRFTILIGLNQPNKLKLSWKIGFLPTRVYEGHHVIKKFSILQMEYWFTSFITPSSTLGLTLHKEIFCSVLKYTINALHELPSLFFTPHFSCVFNALFHFQHNLCQFAFYI